MLAICPQMMRAPANFALACRLGDISAASVSYGMISIAYTSSKKQ